MKLSAQKDATIKGNSVCVFDLDETPHNKFGRHQLFYFNEFIRNEEDVVLICNHINNKQMIPKNINEINNILGDEKIKMNAEQRAEFMSRVEFFKGLGLNPIQAISSVQAEIEVKK